MRNTLAIAWKELRTYFVTPMAYVVISVFLLINGYFFAASVSGSFAEASIRGFLFPASFILLILTPLLTMRLLAEEQKMGTIELLLTAPLRDTEVIMGKFLSSLAIVGAMLALTLWYPVLLFWFGNPDPFPIITGYLGILLVGSAFISVGLFTSSLTSNQIAAAISSFGILLLLWLINAAPQFIKGIPPGIFDYISPSVHFRDFAYGVLDIKALVYYLSFSAIFLFSAIKSLEARRWR
ncbi:MAG: ABC transporter permease subunit [Chloroflexi bacterium]|nr:ABC transporter permease subunit [Chloroflexota bacterium]